MRAASIAGNVQCLQILLDRCADVNMQDKVSGVIIYPVSMQCSTYPESPEVDDDVCAREPCLGRPCFLCYSISVNVSLINVLALKLFN